MGWPLCSPKPGITLYSMGMALISPLPRAEGFVGVMAVQLLCKCAVLCRDWLYLRYWFHHFNFSTWKVWQRRVICLWPRVDQSNDGQSHWIFLLGKWSRKVTVSDCWRLLACGFRRGICRHMYVNHLMICLLVSVKLRTKIVKSEQRLSTLFCYIDSICFRMRTGTFHWCLPDGLGWWCWLHTVHLDESNS